MRTSDLELASHLTGRLRDDLPVQTKYVEETPSIFRLDVSRADRPLTMEEERLVHSLTERYYGAVTFMHAERVDYEDRYLYRVYVQLDEAIEHHECVRCGTTMTLPAGTQHCPHCCGDLAWAGVHAGEAFPHGA